ncbi:MAG: mechanosensitive ion channel family protein [Nevskia sp.]
MSDLISYLSHLDRVLVRNPLSDWLVAIAVSFAILLSVYLVKRLFVRRLSKLAQRTSTRLDDALVDAAESTKLWLTFFVALYFGSQYLDLGKKTEGILDKAVTVAAFLQVGLWIGALLDYWVASSRQRAAATDLGATTSLAALSFIGKLLLWLIMLLFILDNLGINVTALVASLGIGGIAVALAVQNILGDLFASLSIVIDKPFVIGDAINVDTYSGTVEHVGLKTTRVRADTGEQLVFSNSDLLKARLRNYKRMTERRVVLALDVVFTTPPDVIETVPALLREIIEAQKDTRYDRAHMKALAASAYQFELVFWMTTPDYGVYMDTRQAILLAIVRAFAAKEIEIAFSSQSLRIDAPLAHALSLAAPSAPETAPEGRR